ncbi:MAG: nitrite/sulfite reductase, partial [Bacteroidota bacterium]
MFRTKIPYGKLTADQLVRLADVSEKYTNGNLHLTTRQNVQYHYVKLNDATAIWTELAELGVTAREACGNTVRNITASARAGIDPNEPFDVTPYVEATFEYFLRNPICQDMGRKIKIAFSSSEQDSAYTYFHDFGFIPLIKDIDGEAQRGFKVVVAGGLGAQSIVAQTAYEFLPTDQIIPFMEAAIRIFDRYGEREKRYKARMKFLVKQLGLDGFLELVEQERTAIKHQFVAISPNIALPPIPAANTDETTALAVDQDRFDLWLSTNVFAQKQEGFFAVQLRVPKGDIHAKEARKLAQLVKKWAADDLRITVNQGILLRFVRREALVALFNGLDEIGLARPGFDSIADITACPGTDTCNLGVTNSMGLATKLEEVIAEEYPALIQESNLHIKISGCMNACGQHMAANIGFHGSSIKNK